MIISKQKSSEILDILIRYFLIFIFGLGNLYIFYKTLTPLTINSINFVFSLFTKTSVVGNSIHLSSYVIEIVPACVAGSAFYFLFALNLSTPKISLKKRINIIIFSFLLLFLFNVARILILIPFIGSPEFFTIHWLFWHIISTFAVVAIWVFMTTRYKIKEIPIYTDIKSLHKMIS